MADGVTQVWQARVTIYRLGENDAPLQFGAIYTVDSSGKGTLTIPDGDYGVFSILIQRRINEPAAVQVIIPGKRKARPGQRPIAWKRLISKRDWIQIDATVASSTSSVTVSKQLSQSWKTIFLGFIESVSGTDEYSDTTAETNTAILATCQLGIFNASLHNYWSGIPGTVTERDGQKLQYILPLLEGVDGSANDAKVYARSTAFILDAVFKGLIYRFFPMSRRMNGELRNWFDTHAYRFESDFFGVTYTFSEFASNNTTWLEAIQNIVDIPYFYHIYCDMLPVVRANSGDGISEDPFSSQIAKKPAGIFFGRDGQQVAETIIVRPLPFPMYSKRFSGGSVDGYNAAAWENLPTLRLYGEYGSNLTKGADPIFTSYACVWVALQGTDLNVLNAGKTASTILDQHKYRYIAGYQPFMPPLYRQPSIFDSSNQKQPFQFIATEDFVKFNNELAFSFHQYNDLFESGDLQTPIRLDAELGTRVSFRADDTEMLGFIDGYTHSFTPTGATTTISATRVLPLETYNNDLPRQLGRKREDELLPPISNMFASNVRNLQARLGP